MFCFVLTKKQLLYVEWILVYSSTHAHPFYTQSMHIVPELSFPLSFLQYTSVTQTHLLWWFYLEKKSSESQPQIKK